MCKIVKIVRFQECKEYRVRAVMWRLTQQCYVQRGYGTGVNLASGQQVAKGGGGINIIP